MVKEKKKYTFIDLFAGIGGFHTAFHNLGAECVFVSEWDDAARQTYKANYQKISPKIFEDEEHLFVGDITKVDAKDIPDFDILTGGFPCQPFSQAGLKKGFNETRGTLFFDVARIIQEKQPRAFFLENVRGLLTHDNGKTFETIKKVLTEELGYSLHYKIIKASDYGVPQHRPRLYMVGFKNKNTPYEFPEPIPLKMTMSDVWGGHVDKKIGFTLRVGGRHSGVNDRRNWDCYIVDGVEKCMSPKEGLRMQGFPDSFIFPVSETQAMKQLGNSVAVPAIQATAKNIIEALQNEDLQ
ncbi:DNA cytosine methyltransferase [Candidatus Saccharibacteria bacterium]|nr:DNA cytosine methyltransferase [Candidatus Saccharibacteria bacterium]